MSDEETFTLRVRRCKGCGRILTSRESVERGYGCSCLQKAKDEEDARKPLDGQINLFGDDADENIKEDFNNGNQ